MSGESPSERVRAKATALGFQRVGVARAEPLDDDHARYVAFLDAGMHGGMGWLAENVAVRRDVATPDILEGARSVIVCALSYHRGDVAQPMPGAAVARYAHGADYHNFLRRRVRQLAAWLRSEFGARARPMVDTAPVLERAWARRAGVGFVGRNGLVIAPGLGSYLLLGEVVTDLELAPDAPAEERCGSCTRCLDACPTQAFPAPYVLDARRCVSYLTIEHDGPTDPTLRASIGDRIFGCDECQEVCPFNRTAALDPSLTRRFEGRARWAGVTPEGLLRMTPEAWDEAARGSPLARAGWRRMARNAATVLGNGGDRRHLPVLRETMTSTSPEVAEAARWAVEALTAVER